MNAPTKIEGKDRYVAGVLKYAQIGYWEPDYELKAYRVDPVPGAPGQWFACIAHDLDLFEEGSIANLTASMIGKAFGFKPLKALRL